MSRRIAVALLGLAFLSACATPVGVRVAKPRAVHRYLTQNVLSAGKPSTYSEIELRRYDLLDLYDDDPDTALTRLHERALAAGLPADALFALAELSFLRAEDDRDPGRFAAAAHYAFAFLFPEEQREPLDPLDPRSRTAADLYNRSIASAFQRAPGGDVTLREGGLDMPIGHFERVDGPPPDLGGYTLDGFFPVAELEVRGLRNRYRRPGIGAPLAARLGPTPESERQPVPLARSAYMPLTATLRLKEPLAQLRSGAFEGRVDLFPSLEVERIDVGGRAVALEAEPTAALAAGLTESRFWRQELSAFLGNLLGVRGESGVFALRPYRSGRIPVVFVHGTASSPGRWANMLNDLIAGKRIRHRFAFWFFRYDSGNPIAYSAWQLRDALQRAVERTDPGGSDPCLRDMVVLGHSQGGLLTKLTAIDSGTAFWDTVSNTPLEETRFSDEDKALLRNVLFVDPLPFVRRVIFLATPHRGSYLAGPQFVRRLAQRLIRLPSDVVRVSADIAAVAPSSRIGGERIPTSIDNMSPGNPFIRTLVEIPVVPKVTAHSIIAVEGEGPIEEGSDGVVKYQSAHVAGVESELVVHSPHSGMQDKAATIEEVRRILLDHSAGSTCPQPELH
jgi:pimeloyl-ACP methyl ester carboxylesterase